MMTGKKRAADAAEEDEDAVHVAAQKRLSALEEIKAKRAKQAAAKQQAAALVAVGTSSSSFLATTEVTPSASPSLPQAQVLFYYHSRAHSVSLVELKRPEHKGSDDFARYCSWFFLEAGSATRLTFESWDREQDMRTFEEGVLRRNPDNWVTLIADSALPNQIGLESIPPSNLPSGLLDECLRVWDA